MIIRYSKDNKNWTTIYEEDKDWSPTVLDYIIRVNSDKNSDDNYFLAEGRLCQAYGGRAITHHCQVLKKSYPNSIYCKII